MMSDPYAKHPCAKCEVFIKTRTNPNRALICETARALKNCPLMEKAEKWDEFDFDALTKEDYSWIEDYNTLRKRLEAVKSVLNRIYWGDPPVWMKLDFTSYDAGDAKNAVNEITQVLRAAVGGTERARATEPHKTEPPSEALLKRMEECRELEQILEAVKKLVKAAPSFELYNLNPQLDFERQYGLFLIQLRVALGEEASEG